VECSSSRAGGATDEGVSSNAPDDALVAPPNALAGALMTAPRALAGAAAVLARFSFSAFVVAAGFSASYFFSAAEGAANENPPDAALELPGNGNAGAGAPPKMNERVEACADAPNPNVGAAAASSFALQVLAREPPPLLPLSVRLGEERRREPSAWRCRRRALRRVLPFFLPRRDKSCATRRGAARAW